MKKSEFEKRVGADIERMSRALTVVRYGGYAKIMGEYIFFESIDIKLMYFHDTPLILFAGTYAHSLADYGKTWALTKDKLLHKKWREKSEILK